LLLEGDVFGSISFSEAMLADPRAALPSAAKGSRVQENPGKFTITARRRE